MEFLRLNRKYNTLVKAQNHILEHNSKYLNFDNLDLKSRN